MTNRVLIGNRATGGQGLYVSRPGNDVLTCASDKLMFNTNSGETGSNFFSVGHFQAVPVSGGTGGTAPTLTSSTTVSAGATATPTYQNIASTSVFMWGGFTTQTGSSGNEDMTVSYSSIGATSATLTNNASVSKTITNITFNKFSTAALF